MKWLTFLSSCFKEKYWIGIWNVPIVAVVRRIDYVRFYGHITIFCDRVLDIKLCRRSASPFRSLFVFCDFVSRRYRLNVTISIQSYRQCLGRWRRSRLAGRRVSAIKMLHRSKLKKTRNLAIAVSININDSNAIFSKNISCTIFTTLDQETL